MLIAICWGGPIHLGIFPLSIRHITWLPIFYIFGLMLSRQGGKLYLTYNSAHLYLLSYLIIGSYLIYLVLLRAEPTLFPILRTAFQFLNAWSIIFFLLSKSYPTQNLVWRILGFLGKHSLYIYLLHTYILGILIMFVRAYLPFLTLVLLFVVFVVTLLSCLFAIAIIQKIPFRNNLFLGQLFCANDKCE